MGRKRALTSAAATIAATAAPPWAMIATAANCAEPAKTMADMTIAATSLNPAPLATTPKDRATRPPAIANGTAARAPARKASLSIRGPAAMPEPTLLSCRPRAVLRDDLHRVPRLLAVLEGREVVIVENEIAGAHVLLEVGGRRCAGDQQRVLGAVQEPCERDLRGRGAVLVGHGPDGGIGRDRLRPARERRTEREERNERDAALRGQAQRVLVPAQHDAVGVLDLAELDQLERLLDLGDRRVAQPDRLDLALAAQFLHRAQLIGQRDVRALVAIEQAQVDERERLDAERRE